MSFPLIHQPDSMDCGPACLGMIAKYYDKEYNIENLRANSYIGRDGVSLLGISRAAENIGFKTIGGRITFDTLAEKVPLPCIVHWKQEHFVVVYKIVTHEMNGKATRLGRKETVEIYIADPGKGRIRFTKEEFCNNWLSTQTKGEEKGVVLLFEPTPQFYEKNGDTMPGKNRLKFLWKYLVRYKRFFTQLILGLFIGSILQLVFPFLTQAIVDTGIQSKDSGFIWLVLIAQLMFLVEPQLILFAGKYSYISVHV